MGYFLGSADFTSSSNAPVGLYGRTDDLTLRSITFPEKELDVVVEVGVLAEGLVEAIQEERNAGGYSARDASNT